VVPRVIAVAIIGYSAWPSISYLTSPPQSKPAETLPELPKSLLTPKLPPLAKRDPFMSKDAMLAKSKDSQKKTGGTLGKGVADKLAGIGGSAKDGKGAAPNPLSGIALEATSIVGNSRLAIINGRVYGANESIQGLNPSLPKLTVLNVFPYKVLLACDGRTIELAYPDTASPRAASAAPRGAAGNAKPAARSVPGRPKQGSR
jgi:hypothetical protein